MHIYKMFQKCTNFFVEPYESLRILISIQMFSYFFDAYEISQLHISKQQRIYIRSVLMARDKATGPTEKELAILKVLWFHGPSTVRQVNDEINKTQRTGYTTTLKLMQIMTEKGLLIRDDSQFKHIYKPTVSEEKTEKQIVGNVLEKVFSGSAEKLVIRALTARQVSADELNKIRQLLDQMEE